jgi:hypothetical protein
MAKLKLNTMKNIFWLLMISFLTGFANEASACTTFIISGKHTPDGRPILYKHRDTGTLDNAIAYFSDGKYEYIGLVDSNKEWNTMIWGGYNSAGFAIMNSAAYTNNIGDTTKLSGCEGIVMKLALQKCATLSDFEKLLNELPKPLGIDANFGVIDAFGGAAYYETGNNSFIKVDANDPSIAPFGYLIRTNHSFNRNPDKGAGYIRYATASESLYLAAAMNKLEPQYLLNNISRNLTHSLTKDNLWEKLPINNKSTDFRYFEDFIPRNSTASVIAIVGVKNGEDAGNTMMWTILGFPLTTVAAPVWLAAGKNLPFVLSMKENRHAPICDAAIKLKDQCYPIKRGSGLKYINLAAVINSEKTGILQMLEPIENEIFNKTNGLIKAMPAGKPQVEKILEYYKWLDSYITGSYKTLFGIEMK